LWNERGKGDARVCGEAIGEEQTVKPRNCAAKGAAVARRGKREGVKEGPKKRMTCPTLSSGRGRIANLLGGKEKNRPHKEEKKEGVRRKKKTNWTACEPSRKEKKKRQKELERKERRGR